MTSIQPILERSQVFKPSQMLNKPANIPSMDAYNELVAKAETDPNNFWSEMAHKYLSWQKPFTQILDDSNPPFYKWFADGILNVSYNCLDRHIKTGRGDHIAIIFESDNGEVNKITFSQLLARVCQMANALRHLGIVPGDRIVIYMPMSIEGIIAMQACARIGAIHSVVFAGFSTKALNERIDDTQAKMVITANEQIRGGKSYPLKSIVDEAISLSENLTVKKVVVYKRTDTEVSWQEGRDLWWHQICEPESDYAEPEWVSAEHPLFILYTSGSTGKPKGILHSSAGYLIWAQQTLDWSFNLQKDDIFWCTADIGWITGHSYVCYGPTAAGVTQLIFEGIPTFPHADRYWKLIADHHVSVFYTAPTAIRSLIKLTDSNRKLHPRNFDLSSLRVLGSVGEPINASAWIWIFENVGRNQCPVIDTFWQTETGGHLIAPLPNVTPLIPGSCTLALPGIKAEIVNETGNLLPDGEGGLLTIRRPWPGMAKTIWGKPDLFKKNYFPVELGGRYLAGDAAFRDKDTKYFYIVGRVDDVINVSGHRLGTMEIESALVAHPLVAEAAVVSRNDETTGEAIVAFVSLKSGCPDQLQSEALIGELRKWASQEISPIAKPQEIRFSDQLPKTRSGKIMRRLLRSIARGEPIMQDISTLENPSILEQLTKSYEKTNLST